MMLPLRHTILHMPLLSNTLLTLTLSMVTAMAIMTVVVIATMADTAGVKTVVIPLVAMTMVMSMMVTMSSGFLYRWDCVSIRLCICFLFALLWGVSALWKKIR